MEFEQLLVKDDGEQWDIVGTTYSNAMSVDSDLKTLRATYLTIQYVKELLRNGAQVIVSKNIQYPEVQLNEIMIKEVDQLKALKLISLNDINSLMHQEILGVCIIDAMDYLDSYMKLANAGIFITDKNREDKYFEVIEKAQTTQEPAPLDPENTSFDQEQKYIKDQKEYNLAQENLSTLERYLNGYDKLQKIHFVYSMLNEAKEKVEKAQTREDVLKAMEVYKKQLDQFIHPTKFDPSDDSVRQAK